MQNYFSDSGGENVSDLNPGEEVIFTNAPEEQTKLTPQDEYVKISTAKLTLIYKNIDRLEESIKQLKSLMGVLAAEESLSFSTATRSRMTDNDDAKVIEGVFDGEKMIGSDGESYNVPVNYASKSKLVEGDILKLTITSKGAYIFKQIGPIDRSRLVCQLALDEQGNYWALHNNRKWRILAASATYFKGEPGDEVTILIPKEGESRWAAVENIINKY